MENMNYNTETYQTNADNGFAGSFVLERLRSVFSHPLFLTIAILMTVSAGLGVLSGSFDVFSILFAVAGWILYCSSKNQPVINLKGLSLASGTVFASEIVIWVCAGIVAVCGVLCMAIFPLISGFLYGSLERFFDDRAFSGLVISDVSMAIVGVLVGVVLLVLAVLLVLYNIFFVRKAHAFVKSLYESAQTGVYSVVCARTVTSWLLALGIIEAVGLLGCTGDVLLVLAGLSSAAVYFVAYVWMKKCFSDEASR